MPSLERIRDALARHDPAVEPVDDAHHAAVAMVLARTPDGPEVLFIERASHPRDPWSGHMAFPGGRVDPGDASGRAAAERETEEEVGLALEGAERLGRLSDARGNPVTHADLVISAFVYGIDAPRPLRTNYEVREAFWFPLAGLLDPARHVEHRAAGELAFPGILVGAPGRHVVWGLTYRFLESFFEVVGTPLPDRWEGRTRRYARGLRRGRQGPAPRRSGSPGS